MKTTDSEAKPFIEQKDVILCRSGIQVYTAREVEAFITEDNKPPKAKEVYLEYRPANVIVKAQDLFKSLPVTKEHPSEWVTPDNWKELAGGVLDREVTVVALDGESEGEIGLKSNITFFTNELHDYYLDNKEVSVGYTCKKHFVDNPEEVGYDIILDEITEVNHLAITRAGRGGSSVAVIDSIIGGLRPMRTGIFAYLKSKKQAVNDSKTATSFGKEVLDAVKNSKGTTEEELAKEMKGVLDSMSELKDCEAKDTLLNVVKDCFDNKDKAIAEEAELTKTLDSMWIDIHSDSLGEIAKAFSKLGKKPEEKKEEPTVADSENPEGKEKDSKADPDKKDGKAGEADDSKKDDEADKEKKGKDGCNKDSAPAVMTKDDMLAVLKAELPAMVQSAVKECLNIKDDKKPEATGGVVDSKTTETGSSGNFDYESFLE